MMEQKGGDSNSPAPAAGASDDNKEDLHLPSYYNHNGYLMPKGFPVEGFESGLRYKAQPEDLFIATYPKCGTTWTMNIVFLILNDGVPLSGNEKMDDVFPHLEEVGADKVQNLELKGGYRLIKTHLPYSMTPQNSKAKYIYIARNPKDCCVSFFHHTRGFVKHYNFANGTFDAYFRLFSEGKVDFNDYFDCLRSWLDHRGDSNLLFLTYEDMRTDTKRAILTIAEFLGKEWKAKLLENDEAILKLVLEYSSIGSMKKDPQRWASERPKEHTPFIRKGSLGDFSELLSQDQIDLLDKRTRETCSQAELEFLGRFY